MPAAEWSASDSTPSSAAPASRKSTAYMFTHTHTQHARALSSHTHSHTQVPASQNRATAFASAAYSPLMMFVYAYAHTCTHTKSYRGSNLFRLSRLSEVQGQMFPDFLSVAEGALPKHRVSCTRPTQRDCLPSLIRNWCERRRVRVGE